MHLDKSPGPDGFNPAFFQKFSHLVGLEVFDSCYSWLSNLNFPNDINKTNIVLIPKCDRPKSMRDLRPIALCNVLYNILSNVLVNRLKSSLLELVLKA